ncbi:MAG: TetR/AcrR family transcriptional regulator [Chloroflexota bacterium]|nr:TetR/AcrR family transcriptional regulator [Chloroflexota bacterium]
MVTQDRRVRRTQNLLAQALIDLTLEKGYEEVTIRDITERADIGYATFFRHYRDRDALLQEVLDVVLAEITGLLSPAALATDSLAVGIVVFRYVQAHTELVRVLLGSRVVLQRLIAVVTERIAADHAPRPDSIVPLAVAAHHYVSATIALIGWWLDAGQPYPPEQMGRIYHELIAVPTGALAFAV